MPLSELGEQGQSEQPSSYTVWVDENSHYMDSSERYRHGEFPDYESALAACRRIVDEFLAANLRPGMTAERLYKLYTLFGEDPFIVPGRSERLFSAWDYAKKRCGEICSRETGQGPGQ